MAEIDMSIGHIYKVTCKTTGKVYVGQTPDKGNRICFGGKTTTLEEAYEKAKQFINKLPTKPLKINDKVVEVCNSQLPS